MKRMFPLAVLLLLGGCGSSGAEKAASDNSEAADAAVAPVAEVRVASAQLESSSGSITAYGATEAGPGATQSVVAPAEAIVVAVLAPTGTSVGAGQAIVSLRPSRTSRIEAARAASDAQLANAAYARAQRLRRDGLVADADVDTARAAATTARATVANLGIGGGGTTLRAPIGGTVQALTARAGDQIAGGTSLATIAGRGDIRARFGVDPALAARIHPGQTVQIQLTAGGAPITAPVVGVDPSADPTSRLASVFVRMPGGYSLAAGEPLRATVQTGATASGLTIPYSALLDDGGRSFVFVVRGGLANRVAVSPGNSTGDLVQIARGLQAGDKVVVEGGTALEDGMKVHVVGPPR